MEKVEGTFPLRAMSMNHRDGKKELTREVGVNDEQTGVDMKKDRGVDRNQLVKHVVKDL